MMSGCGHLLLPSTSEVKEHLHQKRACFILRELRHTSEYYARFSSLTVKVELPDERHEVLVVVEIRKDFLEQ